MIRCAALVLAMMLAGCFSDDLTADDLCSLEFTDCDSCTGSGCIAAGYYHTCALNDAGEAVCWGWDDYGQSSPPENLPNP